MKRTTYIMIGMLVAGLVAVCGIIGYAAANYTSGDDRFMEMGGARKSVQLPACKVVKLEQPPVEWGHAGVFSANHRTVLFDEVRLAVSPADTLDGSFSFPEALEPFLSFSSAEDTLFITFNFSGGEIGERLRHSNWLMIHAEDMTLRLPEGVERVSVHVESLETVFSGFSCDSLSFRAAGAARVENCRIASLDAQARSLSFSSGEVRDLYLNLDQIARWTVQVDSFRLDTEHLTGSRIFSNTLQRGECRQVLWHPQSEEAALHLELNEDAVVTVGGRSARGRQSMNITTDER